MRRPTWLSEVRRNRQRLEATTIRLVALRKKVVFMAEVMTKDKYAKYLESGHWQRFAYEIKKARRKCEDCGIDALEARHRHKQDLNVHHLTYERIWHEKPEDVVLLCYSCHFRRHGVVDDFKEWAKRFSMTRITHGSRNACANCGALTGPIYLNLDEVQTEWVCSDCRM